ncbi:Morn repeat protein [Pandoravirus kuranda]|uniref:Morn repeat protein n=1 Tax=Pandoravirus kuranda TaxID=3019033 RepID=A0AA95EDX6_9VIRU|nr:Morn repeat protein [Pandoravirus kuranda]
MASPLDDLPDELALELIRSLRSVRAVASLAATSWRYNRLAMDDAVWRDLYLGHFGMPTTRMRLLQADKTWKWLYQTQVPTTKSIGPVVGTRDMRKTVYSGDLLDGAPHGWGMSISSKPPGGEVYSLWKKERKEREERAKRWGQLRPRRRHEAPPPYKPRLYVGKWVRGKRNGRGLGEWDNGDRYEGQWWNNRRHGRGRATSTNGRSYEGDWRDDRPHGRGVAMLPNGDCYEGEWENGRPHGSGSYRCVDGKCIVGTWKAGRCLPKTVATSAGTAFYDESSMSFSVVCADGTRIHAAIDLGACLCLHPDGSSYSGRYSYGRANGHGTFTLPDGRRYDGGWTRDRRQGHGSMLYADGSRWEGEWRDDQRRSGSTITHGRPSPASADPCMCAACLPGHDDMWTPTMAVPLGPHARNFLYVSADMGDYGK